MARWGWGLKAGRSRDPERPGWQRTNGFGNLQYFRAGDHLDFLWFNLPKKVLEKGFFGLLRGSVIYLHKQTSQQAAVLYLTWLQSVVTPRAPHRPSAPSSSHAMGTVRRARRLNVHAHVQRCFCQSEVWIPILGWGWGPFRSL